MPGYQLGSSDPTITPDPGTGAWASTPTEISTHVAKGAILGVLPLANLYPGDDAVAHMLH
ncbi:MAG: hypothetical protein FJ303_11380 [Planctomycetes bacterium]|nr:hypothetical protein [Planctomycetota bacterium]